MKPLLESATRYRIELSGHVDVDWLKSFDDSAEISLEEAGQQEGVTVLTVNTDQSGIVGLVRRLHGLGITILQIQIVSNAGNAAESEENR